MVSHDLRTLLGGIALSAALQIRHAKDDEERWHTVKAARKIQRYTARMNRRIGDLIDVTSIEAGRLSVDLERRDAMALLRETVEAFQPSASANSITLDVELAKGAVLATFDHHRISQVLANLVRIQPGLICVADADLRVVLGSLLGASGRRVPLSKERPSFSKCLRRTSPASPRRLPLTSRWPADQRARCAAWSSWTCCWTPPRSLGSRGRCRVKGASRQLTPHRLPFLS